MATVARAAPKPPQSPESFESMARREAAAAILQSYEKLSWYSFQRCESLAQTRLHFQNIVAGFTEDDEAALVDWKIDNSPHPRPGGGSKARRSTEGSSTGEKHGSARQKHRSAASPPHE